MRKSVIAAVVLPAALALAGCAAETGAAAVVDGRRITVAELDQAVRELQEVSDFDARTVLTILVVADEYIEAAAAHGVAPSADDARALLAQSGEAVGGLSYDLAEASEGTITVARASLAASALREVANASEVFEQVQGEIEALDVSVNPRYGTFSAEAGTIDPLVHEWIVQPAS